MKGIKFSVWILALLCMVACSGQKGEKTAEYPMFWTWLDYRPEMNFDSVCAVMQEVGIEGVMLNAPTPDDYRKAIPVAHKYGIEVYAWLWTMNLEHDRDKILKEHPEWFSVNREGKSLADTTAYVGYYKFMCPALPEVREHIREKIVSYCEVEGLNGIAIDYHRFVDVILPTTLWPRYGIVQDREYPQWDFGYHPAMIEMFKSQFGYDPRELDDPSKDEKWLQFRCDQITQVANMIADVVHSYDKKMAASPFPTPSMARKMVRQDWGKWNLDIVFPMVYHTFYTGDVSFISDCTIENVRQKNPATTLYCGMTASDDAEMFACMDEALNNGAEGIAIFTVSSLRSPEMRKQFRAYTDSVKALRAASPVNPAATGRTDINRDPFENKGIMDAMKMRMSAYLSLAKAAQSPALKGVDWETIEQVTGYALQVNTADDYLQGLDRMGKWNKEARPVAEAVAAQFREDNGRVAVDLGEFELTDQYGATKCYRVTDRNSGVVFNVNFYFYGDIISGWSAEPEATSYAAYRKG